MADHLLSQILPLDSVDVSYLGSHAKSTALCSTDAQYCKIEIIADNEKNSFVLSDTFTCHICNIKVPKMYAQQHQKSKKHDNYKQIFEKVFERTCKIIKLGEDDNMNGNTPADGYYCDICSSIISIQDKENHDQTNFHQESEENDKVVDEFINVFNKHDTRESKKTESQHFNLFRENNNNVEVCTDANVKEEVNDDDAENNVNNTSNLNSDDIKVAKEMNELSISSDYRLNANVFTDVPQDLHQNENSTNDADDYITSNLILEHQPAISDETKTNECTENNTINDNEDDIITTKECDNDHRSETIIKKDFQTILKECIEERGLNIKMPIVEDNYVMIENEDGDKVNMLLDNYNSYRCIEEQMYCQMCSTFVTDTEIHSCSNSHLENILQPINKHFARMLDKLSSHCLICNDVIFSLSIHHNYDEDHMRILNKQMVKKEKKHEEAKTYCTVCNVYIDAHNFLRHTQARRHKEKQARPVPKKIKDRVVTPGPKAPQNLNESVVRVLVQKSLVSEVNGRYHCTSCKIDITNNFLDHVNIPNHLDRIFKELEAKTKPGFCAICETKIPKSAFSMHTVRKPHLKIIKEIKDTVLNAHRLLNDPKTAITPQPLEAINNVPVFNHPVILKTELTTPPSSSLTNNPNTFPKKLHVHDILKSFGQDVLQCRICLVLFPNAVDAIQNHIKEQTHVDKRDTLFSFHKTNIHNYFYCVYCGLPINDPLNHIDSKPHLLKLVESKVVNTKNLTFYIYGNPTDALMAFVYKRFYYKWLLFNKMDENKTPDSSQFTCYKCDVKVPKGNEINHTFTDIHMTYLHK